MAISKVAVNICGMELGISTQDDPAYVQSLASEINKEVES